MCKEDFSRGKCPVCGQTTTYRTNKNGIIYTFCPNGHHAKLSKVDSWEAGKQLTAGKAWTNGVIHMYPLTQEQHQQAQKGEITHARNDDGRWNTNQTGTVDSSTGTNAGNGFDIGFF